MNILLIVCVFRAAHRQTLLRLIEQTLTDSSPNDLHAEQLPGALARKGEEEDKGADKVRRRGG